MATFTIDCKKRSLSGPVLSDYRALDRNGRQLNGCRSLTIFDVIQHNFVVVLRSGPDSVRHAFNRSESTVAKKYDRRDQISKDRGFSDDVVLYFSVVMACSSSVI